MPLRIQSYGLTIRYMIGNEIPTADVLSRPPCKVNNNINFDILVLFLQSSHERQQQLCEETNCPDTAKQLLSPLHQYRAYRDELAVEDGRILNADCVIIPDKLKIDILQQLNASH